MKFTGEKHHFAPKKIKPRQLGTGPCKQDFIGKSVGKSPYFNTRWVFHMITGGIINQTSKKKDMSCHMELYYSEFEFEEHEQQPPPSRACCPLYPRRGCAFVNEKWMRIPFTSTGLRFLRLLVLLLDIFMCSLGVALGVPFLIKGQKSKEPALKSKLDASTTLLELRLWFFYKILFVDRGASSSEMIIVRPGHT